MPFWMIWWENCHCLRNDWTWSLTVTKLIEFDYIVYSVRFFLKPRFSFKSEKLISGNDSIIISLLYDTLVVMHITFFSSSFE